MGKILITMKEENENLSSIKYIKIDREIRLAFPKYLSSVRKFEEYIGTLFSTKCISCWFVR